MGVTVHSMARTYAVAALSSSSSASSSASTVLSVGQPGDVAPLFHSENVDKTARIFFTRGAWMGMSYGDFGDFLHAAYHLSCVGLRLAIDYRIRPEC